MMYTHLRFALGNILFNSKEKLSHAATVHHVLNSLTLKFKKLQQVTLQNTVLCVDPSNTVL